MTSSSDTELDPFLTAYRKLIAFYEVSNEDLARIVETRDPFTLGAEGPSWKAPLREGLQQLAKWAEAQAAPALKERMLQTAGEELQRRQEIRRQMDEAIREAAVIPPWPAPQKLLAHVEALERL